MNEEELLPIGTRVILNDLFYTDLETVIVGYGDTSGRLPYRVRIERPDMGPYNKYPARRDELVPIGAVAKPEPTKAEKLKALVKRSETLWGELRALNADISALGYGGYTTDSVSDAMGNLARVQRELANAAGQAWVNE